ncbi:efflux RND transporter permease subunit [Sulfitobacter geojensis]|uniref:Efflux RND transporter permease subunit n=1 Tax=Sulfitobacter geojensis TaxID=1342299 RepID=A0AAE2W0S2_9RHOB|nr:efflux RND transporter permease subunit [Sulfitobacter geojensis]MBM1690746.1 efflux RND transporter permease subunit [Sulfitobacter geojensis]MBM1694812.1 efflux RND transporter permease subunit [Sulfitobacter geojensis]MBM1707034.1 efflux RND transporter permease subunit [Sulfitobacter geojensis]MBM1711092.1 efflux RND transporter permease subunit [Sulfitobacter geojensis]MBM1715158.1 efflux RND transporter permease subunit [Sulfitobacter geojensis]
MKQILTAPLLFTTLAFPSFAQETARPAKVITVKEETDHIVRRYPERTSAIAGGNRKPRHWACRRQTRRDRGVGGLTFATLLTLIVVPVLYMLFFCIRPDEKPSAQ